MPGPKRRGPKPTLRDAERITVLLERRQLRRVDAYAKRNGWDRSEAIRMLIGLGFAPAAAEPQRSGGK